MAIKKSPRSKPVKPASVRPIPVHTEPEYETGEPEKLYVVVVKRYHDAVTTYSPGDLALHLYDDKPPHLRQPWHFGIGTAVVVPTGLDVQAPQGYRFVVEAALRGYLVSSWENGLTRVYLHNLSSAITLLKHGDLVAIARLVPDIEFMVQVGQDATR